MAATPDTTTPDLTALAARPKRADARRNYDKLVAAAREAFAEEGTDATLEEISERAGVGHRHPLPPLPQARGPARGRPTSAGSKRSAPRPPSTRTCRPGRR